MKNSFSTTFFYIGTFISSFGSLLFVMAIPAFFVKEGFNAEIIGIAVGIHRFSGIGASIWFGPKIDQYNSRNVIFITEVAAALSSIGLILAWLNKDFAGIFPFYVLIGVRALAVGVQSSSRNRLIKLLSSENTRIEASLAIWLNKVTQGAHVASSLAAIPLVSTGNFIYAIAIDGISFLIGGFSALLLPNLDKEVHRTFQVQTFLKAIKNLVNSHKPTFIQDQFLALAVSGTILLMVKLSGGDSKLIIYFNLIFGSCIWISSIFAHNLELRNRNSPYWILMAIGYIWLSFSTSFIEIFVSYFLIYMGYWILFHKYTVEFQTKTSKDLIGSVMAARGLCVAFTLSTGELLGGYISRIFELRSELILRATICIAAIIYISLLKINSKKENT